MRENLPNLIQVEFFPPTKAVLRATFEECLERAFENRRDKIVIRFYDQNGSVTAQVRKTVQAETAYERSVQALKGTRGIRRMLVSTYTGFLLRRTTRLELAATQLLHQTLQTVVRNKQPLAIEPSTFYFRDVDRDEMHELLESVSVCSGVWVFVFPPAPLLTDTPGKPIEYLF